MRSLLAPLLSLALAACDSSADDALVGGTYDVTLYGSEVRADGAVGTGTLVLHSLSEGIRPASFGGTWRLRFVTDDGTRIDDAGIVRGGLDGPSVNLELGHKEIADAGYRLTGTVDGDEIRGGWTIEYGVSEGTALFVARR